MTAEETINDLVKEMQAFPDWEQRYAHIIDMGKTLEPYPEEFRTDEFKVRGCQSQVWLHPVPGPSSLVPGPMNFQADSDALIVRGLIAILLRIYNNRTPDEILAVPKDFVQRLELDQHLSVSRTNGLASMMKQIGLYAVAMKLKAGVAAS
jgi:cysteine desulfuration protein SufE